ncbi:hypothetical protein ADL00_23880 [Streptomyces sp. AS58]|uniref:MFS transporter n=1 Tax=Streptomyces sp. AS58 TaxID=1519489 RepID=UPI0006ADEF07|nr:MFS transporter [Streptomyces sp. AS58]KOV62980.1 hypothetical protein ADL00_23880 [Streptomyces sp. AS58]
MTDSHTTARRTTSRGFGRDWYLYWSAGTISVLGDGIFVAALPLLAAGLTRDPQLISGLTMAGTLPWLVFSLQAGAIADRSDGRRLLVGAQGLQLLCVSLLGLYARWPAQGVWPLYGLAFAVGIGAVAARSAGQAMLPTVVPPEQLIDANSRLFTAESVAQTFLGPAAGAALFAAGRFLPFWVDAGTFALSMLLIVRMTARPAAPPRPRRPIRTEVLVGLRWLARHRLLRTAVALVAVANFANFMTTSTLVLFIGPHRYGLLLSTTALGGIAGALASRPLLARIGGRRAVFGTITVAPLSMIAVAAVGPSLIAVGALTALSSACGTIWTVAAVSQRQRLVPADLQARVASASLMLAWGAQPLGALAGGLIASYLGLQAPWLIGGAVRLAAAVLAIRALSLWED